MNASARSSGFSRVWRTLVTVSVFTSLSCEEAPTQSPIEGAEVEKPVVVAVANGCPLLGGTEFNGPGCNFDLNVFLEQVASVRRELDLFAADVQNRDRYHFARFPSQASTDLADLAASLPATEVVSTEEAPRSDGTKQPVQTQRVPAPPARSLVANLRIDGALHDWASIRSIRAAPDGRVLVLATNAPGKRPTEIRVFSASGVLTDTIGRSGQGPGEFSALTTIGVVGDTIWAGDEVSRRVSWFRSNGTLIRSIEADSLAAGGPLKPGTATPWLLGWSAPQAVFTGGTMLIRPAIGPIRGNAPVPIYRTSSSGIVLDTIVVLQMNVQLVVVPRPSGGGMMPIEIPFPTGQQHAISVDGHRIATAEAVFEGVNAFTIHLRVVDEGGRSVIDRHYPFERIAIPARVADSAIAAIAARTRVAESVIRDAVPIPLSTNPVTGLLVDRDGTVWLRGREGPSGASWTVIDPRGNPAATVRQPANARFIALDGGLWSVERNADSVESLVRYRIVAGG